MRLPGRGRGSGRSSTSSSSNNNYITYSYGSQKRVPSFLLWFVLFFVFSSLFSCTVRSLHVCVSVSTCIFMQQLQQQQQHIALTVISILIEASRLIANQLQLQLLPLLRPLTQSLEDSFYCCCCCFWYSGIFHRCSHVISVRKAKNEKNIFGFGAKTQKFCQLNYALRAPTSTVQSALSTSMLLFNRFFRAFLSLCSRYFTCFHFRSLCLLLFIHFVWRQTRAITTN